MREKKKEKIQHSTTSTLAHKHRNYCSADKLSDCRFNLAGGQTARPGGGADWLRALECFHGVGLVGGSPMLHFVPLIKGRDTGGTGMSPLCMCEGGRGRSQGTLVSGGGTYGTCFTADWIFMPI